MKRLTPSKRWFSWVVMVLFARAVVAMVFGGDAPAADERKLKYEEPRYLAGTIYSAGNRQLLFTFTRVASRSGDKLEVRRDFVYPDGRLAARERVVYRGNDLVLYAVEEAQTGARSSASLRRSSDQSAQASVHFEYVEEAGSRPKVRTEPLRANTLIADMVAPFLASHWEALERGRKLKCRYIVVPRLETVGFTFSKDTQASGNRQDVCIVRMEARSPLVAALVNPLFFTIEKAPPHRVLEYSGRTTPKILVKGSWKDLDAVTVFDWKNAK